MSAAALAALSPAKINLTLHVLGLRPDGFHEIESLVTLLDWGDELSVAPRGDGQVTLECTDPAIPTGETNLAVQAALALRAAAGAPEARGAHILIRKRIPMGAGLGGGSSNAATALLLLNQVWGLNLPAARLSRIAAAIGSDVPLFLHRGMSIVRGRGERIEPVDGPRQGFVLLILPPFSCSTPAVYRRWDELSAPLRRPSAVEVLTRIRRDGNSGGEWFNDLEPAAMSVCPGLAALRATIRRESGLEPHLTGSGAALFLTFDSSGQADAAAETLRRLPDVEIQSCRFLGSQQS